MAMTVGTSAGKGAVPVMNVTPLVDVVAVEEKPARRLRGPRSPAGA